MKATGSLLIAASVALLCGCGATVPIELTGARDAYTRASEGPAAKSAPVELHAAKTALAAAETSYKDDADSYRARDLAYVAQRKAEMAEAQASINTDQASSSKSNSAFRLEQGAQLQERTQDLNDARTQLAVSEEARMGSAEQLLLEQDARLAAEQRLSERDNQVPVAAPVAAPAPAPVPVAAENRDRETLVLYGQSNEASVDQRVAEQVARHDAERKAADQDRQIMENSRQLNETRTALALSEQAAQTTSAQLRDEQRARTDAATKEEDRDRQLKAQTDDLNQARADLEASERAGQASSTELAAAQTARLSAENATAEARAELAKLVASKVTVRGEVFTLSGGVIFRSDEAVLMPGAERKLDQLVKALASTPDRMLVVEGYTDSQGSAEHNLDLSQRRADAVRSYLLRQGYDANQVQAHGIGEASPIADNSTSEGRANNRRVEIVLENSQKQ